MSDSVTAEQQALAIVAVGRQTASLAVGCFDNHGVVDDQAIAALRDFLNKAAIETSQPPAAAAGLRSMGFQLHGSHTSLVVTFDTLENAQIARANFASWATKAPPPPAPIDAAQINEIYERHQRASKLLWGPGAIPGMMLGPMDADAAHRDRGRLLSLLSPEHRIGVESTSADPWISPACQHCIDAHARIDSEGLDVPSGNIDDRVGDLIEILRATETSQPPAVSLPDHLNATVNAETLRNEYRYLWLRRRIAGTIIRRIDPTIEEDTRPEKLDELIDSKSGPCPSLTTSRLAPETRAPEDPLAEVRWICDDCATVNAIDWEKCVGCRKGQRPRQLTERNSLGGGQHP